MELIKINTLNKAIKMLNAVGVQYAVIDFDGNKHGDLNVTDKKTRTREGYEWGSMTKYAMPFVEQAASGEVVIVDAKDFDIEALRGTVSSLLGRKYGAGNGTTAIDREKNIIEIMLII